MSKKDTVIFDFDGTVMDTNGIIMSSWQHVYNAVEGHDGDVDYILSTYGEPLQLSMENAFPDVPLNETVRLYRDHHRKNFISLIRLFPGIEELIVSLKERGCKLGLATSRLAKTTRQGLEKYGLTDYFDAIVTAEDVSKHKPDPESLNRTLQRLGSRPEDSIMLGDTRFDILCARNAGVTSVLAGWSLVLAGRSREDFPAGEAPDHIIHKPEELLDII